MVPTADDYDAIRSRLLELRTPQTYAADILAYIDPDTDRWYLRPLSAGWRQRFESMLDAASSGWGLGRLIKGLPIYDGMSPAEVWDAMIDEALR